MSSPVSILLGAAIVAAAIALTSHWSVQPIYGRVGAVRLNHWSGEVAWCAVPNSSPPNYLDCHPGEWVSVSNAP